MNTIKDPMFDPKGSLQGSERPKTDFLDLETGENVVRMFPASSKSQNNLATFNMKTAWQVINLTLEGGKAKDKKMKPIFDGVVHGGLSKDLVSEYNNFFKNTWLGEFTQNETERLRILDMSMRKSKEIKVSQGIPYYKTQSAFYGKAMKSGGHVRGLFQITYATAKKIATLYSETIEKGQGITYNPLTDKQNGIPIVIDVNPNAQPADYYKVRLYSRSIDGNFMRQEYVPEPMTEEDVTYIEEQRTLDERYINSFTRRDFENQIEGLRNWEKLFEVETGVKVSIMSDERFQEIGNQIQSELEEKIKSGILQEGYKEDQKPTTQNVQQPANQQPVQQPQTQQPVAQQPQAESTQSQGMFNQQSQDQPKPIESGEDLTNRFNALKERFGN